MKLIKAWYEIPFYSRKLDAEENDLGQIRSRYSEDNWGRAAICCVIQGVLQVLSEFTDSDTLESIMQGFFSQFSNVEDAATCKLRTDIMEKIEAIQNILVLL